MTDRRVHASMPDGTRIVRYDKAGKWYVEPLAGKRHAVSVGEAASVATAGGATVHRGLRGGATFEQWCDNISGRKTTT